jgi:hypothetical protein
MRFRWQVWLVVLPLAAQIQSKTGMKLGDFYLHDPFILAHEPGKTYYLYNSAGPKQTGSARSGVLAYKSKDLENWDGPYVVFEVPDGIWANPAHGVWAPEVHEYRGRFYLFATLHNNDKLIDQPEDRAIYQNRLADRHLRGTQIFVSDSPEGPFKIIGDGRLQPPADFMTLDGTLFVEGAAPYMVYAHEWLQMLDGTMEAIRLKPDLSAAAGEPFYLFKASDAPWLLDQQKVSKRMRTYVTDGPFFHRTRNGTLLMIWSSYRDVPNGHEYMQTVARSLTGKLRGPWVQDEPLVGDDSGHGMIFKAFDGRLMLVLHQPFRQARGKLFELEDTGDGLRIKRQIVY